MATSATLPKLALVTTTSVHHESTVELSIRLMHDGVKLPDALKAGHGLAPYSCLYGTLLYDTTKATAPDWAKFLEPSAPGLTVELSGQHSSAVLLIEAGPTGGKRLFAVCFGQGHHAIETDRMERQFGMRVVLNCVARDKLREMNSASLDATVIQRNTQASRESDLADFGLDTNRDLLRLASGIPNDAALAKAMSGKDALKVRRKMAISSLPVFCARLLKLYDAKDYEKDYKFIDQVRPVHKGPLLDTLDNLLFVELCGVVAGNPSDLHLAVPDILSADLIPELSYIGANLPRKKGEFTTLAIEDYVSELKKGLFSKFKSMAEIRSSHEIRAVSSDPNQPFNSMKLYDCFVFETVYGVATYVLFDGLWYKIDDIYYKNVEQFYLSLLKPAFLLSSTAKNERALIHELCSSKYPELLCLDQTKVSPAGAKGSNLEPCDFLAKTTSMSLQLIHLKDSESSAPLSHLWNQGLVSAQSLMHDSVFRQGVRKVTNDREKIHCRSGFVGMLPTAAKITPSEYTVVYGILKKKNTITKKLSIPFFSKVALRGTAEQLMMMGYKTELHLIEKI